MLPLLYLLDRQIQVLLSLYGEDRHSGEKENCTRL